MVLPLQPKNNASTAEVRFEGWYGLHLATAPRLQILPCIIVLGPPGVGKSTLAEMLEHTYHVKHIDLARQFAGAFSSLQAALGSTRWPHSAWEWEQGANVPPEIALHCLLAAMNRAVDRPGIEGFVISGTTGPLLLQSSVPSPSPTMSLADSGPSGFLGTTRLARRLATVLDPPPCFIALDADHLLRLDRLLRSPRCDAFGTRHDDARAIGRRSAVYRAANERVLDWLAHRCRVHRLLALDLGRLYESALAVVDEAVGLRKRQYRLITQNLVDLQLKETGKSRTGTGPTGGDRLRG